MKKKIAAIITSCLLIFGLGLSQTNATAMDPDCEDMIGVWHVCDSQDIDDITELIKSTCGVDDLPPGVIFVVIPC